MPSPPLDAWQPWTPDEVRRRLRGAGFRWAVAGGWALELAGLISRAHEDIEIVIGSDTDDLERAHAAMSDLRWYSAGDGIVVDVDEDPARIEQTFQTWGWDAAAGAWRIDVTREPWQDGTWVYRRDPRVTLPLSLAICQTGKGRPYLTPEIVLLFKAKHMRDKDIADFESALPRLDPAAREWLAMALDFAHPGHPWAGRLRA